MLLEAGWVGRPWEAVGIESGQRDPASSLVLVCRIANLYGKKWPSNVHHEEEISHIRSEHLDLSLTITIAKAIVRTRHNTTQHTISTRTPEAVTSTSKLMFRGSGHTLAIHSPMGRLRLEERVSTSGWMHSGRVGILLKGVKLS